SKNLVADIIKIKLKERGIEADVKIDKDGNVMYTMIPVPEEKKVFKLPPFPLPKKKKNPQLPPMNPPKQKTQKKKNNKQNPSPPFPPTPPPPPPPPPLSPSLSFFLFSPLLFFLPLLFSF
ncbi:hypothetical protein ACW0S9_01050, partial [Fusobacterium polymorphum]